MKKNQKGISLIILILIIVIIIGVITTISGSNSIENISLTKDNYKEIMNKYKEQKEYTNEIYYVAFACMYHSYTIDLYITMHPETKDLGSFANIAGKTIKDLKKEGKLLMKVYNMTPQKVKQLKTFYQY